MFAGYDPFEALYASAAATIVDFSVEQALVLALLVRLPTANTTIPARMPRMTITMSSSTRVKPFSMTFWWSSVDRSFFSTRWSFLMRGEYMAPARRASFAHAAIQNGRVSCALNRHIDPFGGL